MDHSAPVPLASSDGTPFLIYSGDNGTVFLERIRPSGRRDSGSIFQFDQSALASAIDRVVSTVASAVVLVPIHGLVA